MIVRNAASSSARETLDNYVRPVRDHHNKKKKKRPPPGAVKDNEVKHPRHQPYVRPNRGELRTSLMIDGLGEE